MEDKRETQYLPCWIEVVELLGEDVIRTSYVNDNYGGWDDDDALPVGDAGQF